MKVCDAIRQTLRSELVQQVFAVMGDGNMRWLAELTKRTGIAVALARNDASAVAMADGYARATAQIGVCSVTAGPGLALAALPLVTAARHRTPLLLIAGAVAVGDTENIQYMDQRRFVQGLGLASYELVRPDFVVEDLQSCFSVARRTHQPVVVNIPMDIQDAEYPWDVAERHSILEDEVRPTTEALERAAQLVSNSERPIVIAGRGALEDHAATAVAKLATTIGAPVATTLLAKGFLAGPLSIGIAGLFSSSNTQEAFSQSDCVIAVGASLNDYTTLGGNLFSQAQVVQIDVQPQQALRRAVTVGCYLQGGARVTAEELLRSLPERPSHEIWCSVNEVARDEPTATVDDGRLHPSWAMATASKALRADAMFVVGVGHFWWFAIDGIEPRERRFIFTHDFGAIGQGLPMAIGAASSGSPTVLVEGDASLTMSVQELDTASRYSLPLTVLVLNDEALGAEYHKLESKNIDPTAAVMRSPDLVGIARSFGIDAYLARTAEDLEDALSRCRSATGPTLIDIRVSRTVISEPYRRLYFPT